MIRVETLLAHMIHVRVLTTNTFPLGTSGVRVAVSIVTYSSKSQYAVSSRISHFVDLGPMLPFKGLMYDMFLVSFVGFSGRGAQSEIWISDRRLCQLSVSLGVTCWRYL